jgi:hypothetical protein
LGAAAHEESGQCYIVVTLCVCCCNSRILSSYCEQYVRGVRKGHLGRKVGLGQTKVIHRKGIGHAERNLTQPNYESTEYAVRSTDKALLEVKKCYKLEDTAAIRSMMKHFKHEVFAEIRSTDEAL